MKISVISFTRAGASKNLELVRSLQENDHQAVSYSWHKYTGRKLIPFKSLKLLLQDLWENQDAFLFLWDLEHVSHAVAPYLKQKGQGPAVVVMDEAGRFVIPFCAGKEKGINDWCRWFAQLMDAVWVDMLPKMQEEAFGVDAFAGKNQLHIQDIFRIRTIAAKLSAKEPVGIYSDYPIEGVLPEGLVCVGEVMHGDAPGKKDFPEAGISITDDWEAPHFAKECRMFPRNLVLGVICPKDVCASELEQLVTDVLVQKHLSKERICSLFSIRELADAPGIKALADRLDVPFFTYEKGEVAGADEKEVCEGCARMGSGGKRLEGCREKNGMLLSVYEKEVELHF